MLRCVFFLLFGPGLAPGDCRWETVFLSAESESLTARHCACKYLLVRGSRLRFGPAAPAAWPRIQISGNSKSEHGGCLNCIIAGDPR